MTKRTILLIWLVLLLSVFACGLLSGDEVEPSEPPEAEIAVPETDTPQTEVEQQPIESPEGTPQTPDQGLLPHKGNVSGVFHELPRGATDGALLAQAGPEGATSVPEPESVPTTAPDPAQFDSSPILPTDSAPAEGIIESDEIEEQSGPEQETEGVGNLANLTNTAGGRGFQLYLIIVFLGLSTVLYLALRRARLEGKPK